jgi:glucose uptake protein GlcU
MVDFFDSCTDSCGWAAAVIAALAYGSFGVPIKETKDIDVHPLVLQSYKTFVMFVMCWGVILLGVEVKFTRWGLLSGLLWVLGGTGGVYGIRMAGLAIAVGTWASIMIMVNFFFGILIFREPVHDIWGTMASFLLLILGLVGMSLFSAHKPKEHTTVVDETNKTEESLTDGSSSDYQNLESHAHKRSVDSDPENSFTERDETTAAICKNNENRDHEAHVVIFAGRLPLTKRQCGILGAAMNGVLTGGSLIPLHYAKEEGFGGAKYIISMACGAFLSNILIWGAFFLYSMMAHRDTARSVQDILQTMPRWHFRKLWLPGSIAGILLSIGMFGSILAVTYLGQGVGNSLVQTKILVSGVWGILWFKEITGTSTILKWFLSATVAVLGIVWLSLERLLASEDEAGH